MFASAGPLRESIAADVADDRAEEDEDKEMILGEHLVNPFTGGCMCVGGGHLNLGLFLWVGQLGGEI